jgi:hypothetical protein
MEPDTLNKGLSPVHVLVLLGLMVILLAFSIPAFIRRDIAK